MSCGKCAFGPVELSEPVELTSKDSLSPVIPQNWENSSIDASAPKIECVSGNGHEVTKAPGAKKVKLPDLFASIGSPSHILEDAFKNKDARWIREFLKLEELEEEGLPKRFADAFILDDQVLPMFISALKKENPDGSEKGRIKSFLQKVNILAYFCGNPSADDTSVLETIVSDKEARNAERKIKEGKRVVDFEWHRFYFNFAVFLVSRADRGVDVLEFIKAKYTEYMRRKWVIRELTHKEAQSKQYVTIEPPSLDKILAKLYGKHNKWHSLYIFKGSVDQYNWVIGPDEDTVHRKVKNIMIASTERLKIYCKGYRFGPNKAVFVVPTGEKHEEDKAAKMFKSWIDKDSDTQVSHSYDVEAIVKTLKEDINDDCKILCLQWNGENVEKQIIKQQTLDGVISGVIEKVYEEDLINEYHFSLHDVIYVVPSSFVSHKPKDPMSEYNKWRTKNPNWCAPKAFVADAIVGYLLENIKDGFKVFCIAQGSDGKPALTVECPATREKLTKKVESVINFVKPPAKKPPAKKPATQPAKKMLA